LDKRKQILDASFDQRENFCFNHQKYVYVNLYYKDRTSFDRESEDDLWRIIKSRIKSVAFFTDEEHSIVQFDDELYRGHFE